MLSADYNRGKFAALSKFSNDPEGLSQLIQEYGLSGRLTPKTMGELKSYFQGGDAFGRAAASGQLAQHATAFEKHDSRIPRIAPAQVPTGAPIPLTQVAPTPKPTRALPPNADTRPMASPPKPAAGATSANISPAQIEQRNAGLGSSPARRPLPKITAPSFTRP